jgi:hypothetical protein
VANLYHESEEVVSAAEHHLIFLGTVNLFKKTIVIPVNAGIQICTSDQDISKTVLMNELDSGSSPE